MPAVGDSSPLITYPWVGRLDLLREVFDEILIPPAVRNEVAGTGERRAGATEVQTAGWIRWRDCPPRLQELTRLGAGEAEAITLALHLGPDLPVLLDDLPARRAAQGLGVEVVGSVGVLLLAKDRGIISSVQPHLFDLLDAGLYLGRRAVRELLDQIGE